MKCQGYYPICQNKGKVIIEFGSNKEKWGLCKHCAIKYLESCSIEEKKIIEQAILIHKAVNGFIKRKKLLISLKIIFHYSNSFPVFISG